MLGTIYIFVRLQLHFWRIMDHTTGDVFIVIVCIVLYRTIKSVFSPTFLAEIFFSTDHDSFHKLSLSLSYISDSVIKKSEITDNCSV